MLVPASAIYGWVLLAAIHGLNVDALAIRRHDDIQRMAKSPQITQPATVLQRKDSVCGIDMKLCPASLGGNCCPESYECASDGCYSTTSSTETASASSSIYSCPTGQHPCLSSVGYGCCPDGLDGRTNDDNDSQAADSTPTSVPKYVPSSTATDGDDDGDESLSTTQLGGIIGGAIALLALVIAAACVMIRHIDKLAAQMSRKSNSSRSRTATKQTSLSSLSSRSSRTDSTNTSTRRSRTRRKARSTDRRHRQRRNGVIATRAGDLLIQGAHGRQESSRAIPLQVLTRNANGGGAVVPDPRHTDVVSPTAINDVSPRQLSSPSPLSMMSTELEASSLAQELAGTSNAATLAADSLIHNARDVPPTDLPRVATRPPLAYQWMRSIGLLRESEVTSPDDYRIEEESHGFYGSRDHVAGRTGLGINYTEVRGGRPGHFFCPMSKRTYGSV
ncbi:hypothetical protein BBK36DRAFT_1180049 [Trichoderma citrinoviride]|uniref:Uncharacterized protein n=1 Tax=Trichoderma citrinoviride TaxID=58853 RepID=A0A2T4B2Z0_9HYPO|nr:hypothetical protein BBK36DRAFT_1180049 [Trichoderma citrinoviride]PTB63689.1 hypothetical protein BBK36DRAFT_1180049 [Trichoderma citrinoviride]